MFKQNLFPRAAAATIVVGLALFSAHAGPLEGRWRLAEEHYEAGQSNLAKLKPSVVLEIAVGAGAPAVSIRMGNDPARAVAWPAYLTGAGAVPVDVLERTDLPARGELRARYRVPPPPGDDLVLEIVEHYRLDEGADALTGTVTVKFFRGGKSRGSFVLHRRFERER